jgi:tripartite-type tricarboxylate transporter receptor subunit TctC
MAGVDIVHVPHKESSGARVSVMGGQVQIMFDAITVMAKQAEAGTVRALATTGRTRAALTPNLPTVAEAGVPGYEAVIWLGLMAPAGTPKPVVDRVNAEVRKILAQPDVKDAWAKQGAVPMSMTPEEFGAFLNQDIDKWAKVVKSANMTVN